MKSLGTALVVCLVFASAAFAQSDPFHGKWRLNVAKSTFAPGQAAKQEVVTYTITGDEEKFFADGITASGARDVFEYTGRYDGKEYPGTVTITENGKERRTNSMFILRKVNPTTRERVTMRDGKVAGISRRTLLDNGKTLKTELISLDAAGKETVRQVRMFDKQ